MKNLEVSIDSNKLISVLTSWAFILSFPISYIANLTFLFDGREVIKSPLLLKIPVYLCLFWLYWRKFFNGAFSANTKLHLLIWIFLTSIFFSICFGYFNSDFGDQWSILFYYFRAAFFFVIFFITGYFIQASSINKRALLVLLLLMALLTFLRTDFNTYSLQFDGVFNAELIGTYLYLGDAFAITSLFLLSILKDRSLAFFIIIISAAVLFVVNSRASFYIYIFVVILGLAMSRQFVLFAACVIPAAAFLVQILHGGIIGSAFMNRMTEYWVTGKDTSLDARLDIQRVGYEHIREHPILGSLGGQIREFGDTGNYIHNIFSYWEEFGLINFVVLLIVLFCVWLWLIKAFLRYPETINKNLPFVLIFLFSFTELVFVRSFVSPYIWLSFGMFLRIIDGELKGSK